MKTWFLPALVTLFCWGVWGFIPKITLRYVNAMSAVVYETIGVVIAGFIVLLALGFRPDINPRGIALGVVTGLVGMLGALTFLVALRTGKVSLVAMFTALSPIITISLAYFILREPITPKEGLGMLCAFVAILLFAT
jgi:transporter family protein